MRRRRQDERGSASLLVTGFFLVVALTVVVVVDASAAYLQRQGLASLADSAALAAADGVKAEQAYAGRLGDRATVDPAVARRQVRAHLDRVRARSRYPRLRIAVTTDGRVVRVRLSAPLDLPLTPQGWTARRSVTAEAAAYVVVGS